MPVPTRSRSPRTPFALAAAIVFSFALAAAAPSSSAGPKPRPAAAQNGPAKADLNGNKIFDDLEARLDQAGSNGLDVIVVLNGAASEERIDALRAKAGRFAVSHRFSVVGGFAGTLTQGQVRALARMPEVVHVQENAVVRAFNDTAQSSFGVTKARADSPSLDGDGDGAVATYSKDDLVAAVIDTGIDPGHLDLDEGKVIGFKDFVNGRETAYDDQGHGTHVAATIAGDGDARADGLYKGVAPGAGLVGVKVLDASGSGSDANVTAAIDWVVQNKDVYGIEAINLSLGTSGCSDGADATSLAVNAADDAGIVVAVAAGNDGPGTCTVGSPGAAAKALTVGAMADLGAGGFRQASFSSRGPTADGRTKPDVSAPGVTVTSAQHGTTNGYVAYSGTSMATPFVAGVALLMRDASAGLTPQQVKDTIMQTAIDWGRGGNNKLSGSRGVDIDYGAGRLDAHAALKAAGAGVASAPTVPVHELREGTLSATGASVDYKLNVVDVQAPIAATLIIPGIAGAGAATPDFDMYLLNPSGTIVARAETANRQDDLAFKPTATGTYTLRVKSYSGSGGFFVDVSAGLGTDTTAPSISSVSPASGAVGVPVNANVSVAFSEPMDRASVQAAFSLVKSADGSAVAGTFSWSGNTMVFDPTSDLARGAQYAAKVTTAAKDAAGNGLAAEKSWTFTVTSLTTVTASPSSFSIYFGTLRSGDVSRLAADDNSYLQLNSTTSSTRATDWYGRFTGVSNALASLKLTYRGLSSATCTQQVFLYNWTTATWVGLDTRSVSTTEIQVSPTVTGTLANYVSGTSGDGDVAMRIRCSRSDALNFYSSADLMRIVYEK